MHCILVRLSPGGRDRFFKRSAEKSERGSQKFDF